MSVPRSDRRPFPLLSLPGPWGASPVVLPAVFLLLGLPALVPAEEVLAQAETELSVEIGFQGRFVADHYARIRVSIQHDGPPLEGELVLRQTIHRPLAERRTVEVRRPVRLAPGARPVYELYMPLSSLAPPEGKGPELHVELRARDRTVARAVLPLGDRVGFQAFTLLVDEGSYPRLLPTGERVEELRPEELPHDWRGYGGVRRIYLGRIAVGRLLPEQKRALEKWLAAGGELVVLGGENFLLQDDPWLRTLLPLAVTEVQVVEALGLRAATGAPRGEVLYQVGEHPLILRRSWGLGTVYFSALDLRGASVIEVEGWQALTPRSEDLRPSPPEFDFGTEVFQKVEVLLPSLGVYGGLLGLYLLGLAGIALWILKRPRWLVGSTRWEEATPSRSEGAGGTGAGGGNPTASAPYGGGWRAFLLLMGWLALCSGALAAYLVRPPFTRDAQSLEVGFLLGREGSDWALRETWYSVLHRRPGPLTIPVDAEALIYPVSPVSPSPGDGVQLTLEAASGGLRVFLEPPPGDGTRWSSRGFYQKGVLPLDIGVDIESEPVRNPIARVYNGTPWHLKQAALWHVGTVYELGDLPPGEAREVDLSRTGKSEWVFRGAEPRRLNREVKERLYREARQRYPWEGSAWTLLAWVEEEGPRTDTSEYRQSYVLLIVSSEAKGKNKNENKNEEGKDS